MPQHPQLVSLGEALIDLIGDPQQGYRAIPGGSPLNVALAAARLGERCALLTRFSNDPFGELLRAHLLASGVDLSLAEVGSEPTSLALVTLDAEGQARYSFYRNGSADVSYNPQPRPQLPASVRIGSVTLSLLQPPARDAYLELVASSGRQGGNAVTWILDPNARPALWPEPDAFVSELQRWLPLVDILKVSHEDVRFLGDDREALVRRAHAAGIAAVVVTEGAAGATLHRTDRPPLRVPAPRVAVVDTVGAGDTFTAALASGLRQAGAYPQLGDEAWRALLQRANHAAAITCTRAGADPPTAAELREKG